MQLTAHEHFCLRNADYFTACVFAGRGKYVREEAKTIQAIRTKARSLVKRVNNGRPAMIYAVAGVHFAHLENIE